ncbi:MAG: ArgE/DapE family deacylase [Candidatus Bathyarchaeota archaeon]|nr:ArgE/DapE family deacylase [Candidatus Bathyarchaeota archaeon]
MHDDLLKKIDHDYTVKKLEEMIAIPSVVKEEKELAHYLQDELEKLGLETELHMVEPGRPNIYGRLKGAKPGKRLNYGGHMDTVPVVPGWETDPFKPVKKDGNIYGLGANDMKAGLACALSMLKAFADSSYQFNGELSFAGVIDEEAYGEGAKAMLKTDWGKVDAIVLGEPSTGEPDNPTPLGITGKVLYDIYVYGKAAHGFHPQAGINAVEQAGIILANLPKLKIAEKEGFQGNYSTLKIEGGYKVYSVVVPAECRFEVNRLTVPGETVEGVIKDMEDLIASLNLDVEVEVKTKPPLYASYVLDKETPFVKVFDETFRDVVGHECVYEYSSSITDANTFTGEGGIPAMHLGPYAGGTHQKNEYTKLDTIPPVTKVYTELAARYLS